MLTPIVRVRFLSAEFDSYSEQGSAQTLSVSRRDINDVEERAELDFAHVDPAGVLKTTLKGGVVGLERLGDTSVNAALLGQGIAFATPGQNASAGVFAGVGLDFRVTNHINLFAGAEGTLMTDHSNYGTVKGGVRAAF
jgi:hypothetical protein